MNEVIQCFHDYVQQFDLNNIDLKRKYEHAYRVMHWIKVLAQSIDLKEEDVELSCIIGLLHDIGRFEQLKETNTYDDMKFEHADFGADYLKNSSFLEQCHIPEEWKMVIVTATQLHNKYSIPDYLDERTLQFVKLIRDADKIDIMKQQCYHPHVYKGNINYGEETSTKKYKVKLAAPDMYEMFSAFDYDSVAMKSYWLINSSTRQYTKAVVSDIGVVMYGDLYDYGEYGVRPVGYLDKNCVVVRGKGTSQDPYIITK